MRIFARERKSRGEKHVAGLAYGYPCKMDDAWEDDTRELGVAIRQER